jgi:outer membrane protein TolC
MFLVNKYVFGFACCTVANLASAADLLADFVQAQRSDLTFLAATSDSETGRVMAKMSSWAFFPEARLSVTQMDNEDGMRRTASIAQPLFSLDRWLAMKESEPRLDIAAAGFERSQQELALRLFKAVSSFVEAREKLRLNESSIQTLKIQADSARKSYELGVGTVTDLRDTEVRLASMKSQYYALKANLDSSSKQYKSIVGKGLQGNEYGLSNGTIPLKIESIEYFVDRASTLSPNVRISAANAVLADIAADRSKAIYLPSVFAQAQVSDYRGRRVRSQGVIAKMEVPIQTGSYFTATAKEIEVKKQRDLEKDARSKAGLEAERLFALVESMRLELDARREAIQSAALSVEANEKSFAGGVRTKIDVLNALQAQYQAESDYVSALLRYGEGILSLHLNSAVGVDAALQSVQSQVFRRQ